MKVAGCYEDGNELSGSVKGWKVLDWLSDSQVVKNSAPCFCLISYEPIELRECDCSALDVCGHKEL
jgi:hypothetical protein